jgi:2-amino-4-hydroxy-6-hydroxymethyldihydropteridine diphosphokinase
MANVYFGLGANLGDKEQNLTKAVLELSLRVGEVLKISSFYRSQPWGFESENEFLNMVVLVKTDLLPLELLLKTQEIELQLGRTSKTTSNYSDRIIDIDILFYDDLIFTHPKLKIPHPLLVERDFVLIPLSEIAPNLVHPVLEKSISELVALQSML